MRRSAADTTIQRLLDGKTAADSRIKIWLGTAADQGEKDKKVQEVYLAKDYKPGDPFVSYYDKKLSPKLKKTTTPLKIAAALAFSSDKPNKEIEEEFAQQQTAKSLSHPEHGDLSIPDDVVKYLTAIAEEHKDDDGIEIDFQLTRERIMIAASETDTLAMNLTKSAKAPPKEIKDLFKDEYYITEFMEMVQGTGSQRDKGGQGSGGGGGSEEWKTKQTDDLKAALVRTLHGKTGAEFLNKGSTLHHKLSRERLKKMLQWLKEMPSDTPGVTETYQFISMVEGLTNQKGRSEDALCNWTANIELGPLADQRLGGDDPGKLFDGSYLKGVATPRTEQLEEAALILERATKASDVNWAKLAQHLNQAQVEHKQITDAETREEHDLTYPHLKMWTKGKDEKYTRGKKAAVKV